MTTGQDLALIVAFDEDRAIGRDGGIPWHHPADMKHFRRTTTGHALIMGRNTYQSIGKPLPKRHTIVVSRNPDLDAPGCTVVPDLTHALRVARGLDPMPFVCGGGQIYALALPWVTRLYITEIPGHHQGDSFFAELNPDEFVETQVDHTDGLTFRTLERRK